jgi:hypothetical protein
LLTDFEALWSDSYKEFPGEFSLIKKLGNMGKKMRQWNKSTFGDQNLKLADIQNSITTLENKSEVCPLSETEKTKLQGLNSDLWEVNRRVEDIWRQKSRQNWCKMGDKNTRFFHISASLRKGRNYISKIDHNGSHLVSPNDIKEGAVNFFSSLFRKPTCKRIEMGGSGFSKISEAKSIWLERPPSMEEVKQAVWDCDGSKAPGPDGFTFSFYKKVWNIISSEVFMLVKSFFRTGKLPKGISSSFVTLIPKSKGPSRFSHFRPISLIHGLYKIVAKLLSTRLRRVLTDVISVNQSAFIAGRQILDGFMIANEVVHGVRSKKEHGLLLKVDFHKAFDSILWEHIDTSMGYMGFGPHWRKLIFECLSTSKLAILINGSPSREFSLERGLRQGDPLSPFLFDIAVQGLTVLFNRASASGYFKGLQTAPGHYITHLQYADDSLIFLPNDFPSLLHAKRILRWFEIISGLKVNFYKSSLIGINLDNDYL